MSLTQLGLFPLLSVTFAILAFFISYAIAVSNEHVDAWLPFISDCAARVPESMIFGQLLNISAFFLFITVYLVHRNTVVFYEKFNDKKMENWKVLSFFLMLIGWVAALGASMVANFQESNQLATHDVGAMMFFIGILIYFWGQLIIAYGLKPRMVSIHLTNFRLLLNLLMTAILIFHLCCLFGQVFVKNDPKTHKKPTAPPYPYNIERVKKGEPFYTNHMAATISEWVLALLIEFSVLLYIYDFAFSVLKAPGVSPEKFNDVSTENSKIYYAHNKVSPLDDRSYDLLETTATRRLPRIETMDAAHFPSTSTQSYPRSSAVASYNQYQYY